MAIYSLLVIGEKRFVRAVSSAAAAVRFFKAFGARGMVRRENGSAQECIPLAYAYDQACNRIEKATSARELIAMQETGGTDNTGRAFYKPSEAEKTRTNNKAQVALTRYAL